MLWPGRFFELRTNPVGGYASLLAIRQNWSLEERRLDAPLSSEGRSGHAMKLSAGFVNAEFGPARTLSEFRPRHRLPPTTAQSIRGGSFCRAMEPTPKPTGASLATTSRTNRLPVKFTPANTQWLAAIDTHCAQGVMVTNSPWFTPEQAAEYLSVALGTLRNWTSGSVGGPAGVAIAILAATVFEGGKYAWNSRRELEGERRVFGAKCEVARSQIKEVVHYDM